MSSLSAIRNNVLAVGLLYILTVEFNTQLTLNGGLTSSHKDILFGVPYKLQVAAVVQWLSHMQFCVTSHVLKILSLNPTWGDLPLPVFLQYSLTKDMYMPHNQSVHLAIL